MRPAGGGVQERKERSFSLLAVSSAMRASGAGTMVLPMGQRARPASLTCCQAKGMPMRQGDPDARQQQPDNVAQRAKGACAYVRLAGERLAGHGHLAEGKKGELPHDKTGPAPGNAHDGEEAEHADKPPAQAHPDAAQQKPDHIAQTTHGCFFLVRVASCLPVLLSCAPGPCAFANSP